MLARRMAVRRRIALVVSALAAGALGLSACGSQEVSVQASDPTHPGAELFSTHCAGCHTFKKAGAQGGAFNIKDRERVDGPSFDARKETRDQVLFAIRNGGFSGAIMPENIVTGREADLVAEFLAKYSGRGGESPATSGQSSGQ
jgi:mono/diheme cytochrome c family protein